MGPADRRSPHTAMVLAAGRGTRLGALGRQTPKPLIPVGGRPLIDHALDMLDAIGIRRVGVNTYHLADRLEAHLAGRRRPEIVISRESTLLETGGGVRNALRRLGPDPFFVVNGDLVWSPGSDRSLRRMCEAWSGGLMDVLLLLYPTVQTVHYDGLGDFMCDPSGRLTRRPERLVAPFVYTGVQLLRPEAFADTPEGPFSLNLIYDRAAEAGRLFGILHEGSWLDAGTPERLAHARAILDGDLQGRLL